MKRVIEICDRFALMDEIKPLDSVMKATILYNMKALASQGLSVLAIAYKLHNRSVSAYDSQMELLPLTNASSVILSFTASWESTICPVLSSKTVFSCVKALVSSSICL